MTFERKLSIVNLIIKAVLIVLLSIAIYNIVNSIKEFISQVGEKNISFKSLLDNAILYIKSGGANDKKEDTEYFVKLIAHLRENIKNLIFIIVSLILLGLANIFDIVILSIASWKSQAAGKALILVAIIVSPLWVLSIFGNIAIISKKRVFV
ncbi:hypothetical protein [Metamycoplasma canadense]|uniref:Uncharacterized protein n=1 Tax=Metamycoplasma canadense TaxID=29554 RepID=A0A077L913_9BACT|nr:hypothetical protein [Metamycoplasma canadense]BAP39488.1 hypothetical protein MCAN360_0268 [Metamycoplasma canadense]